MFPSQTSLIPITVALARFIEVNGLASMFGYYPFWYLGVPYRYLTGPVVPLALALSHRLLNNVSLFAITIYLVALSFILGALGWGILARIVTKRKGIGMIVSTLFLLLPWKYLSSIALSEASAIIAKNFLPFTFLAFWGYFEKRSGKTLVLAVLALSVLLLVNTSAFTTFLVGLTALVMAYSFKKGKIKGVTKRLRISLVPILFSLILATLWYTPGYWWTVIANPSIGGAAGYKAFLRIVDLLRATLPLVFAIAAVYFSGKIKSRFLVFSLTWTLTFIFLTIFRFIGDPDFWQDWSSWFFELETGIALIAALPIWAFFANLKRKEKDLLYSRRIYFVILIILISPFLLSKYIYKLLDRPRLILSSPPQSVMSLEKLAEVSGDARTFLSGSTVFWANALFDIRQVRGGVDKAATHPLWDHAAYQLREGESPELATAWLRVLGVEYVLVHGPASTEAYHDFANLEKWSKVGDKIWEGGGDTIYSLENSGLAWEVDFNGLKAAKLPQDGKDLVALQNYLALRKNPIRSEKTGQGYRLYSDNSMQEVLFLVSYSPNWKAYNRNGQKLETEKDIFGHLLIHAAGSKEIKLSI